ncbi:MAG: Stk1 family PASTA domain-containing Ser/Thr kinase [Clostridia bacterium]|nr:Stk1 family PASTA domain-containing Ser/Thr kinase [Clostridia bacterium]
MSKSGKFDSLVGEVIDKRYKILSVIGEGGMSVVFKARDLTTDRNVAIKVLNESSDPDGQAVKLFMNESRAISMLSHENIVKIYDVSVSRELKYIVMELVEGDTLKGYMDKHGKKLSIDEALDYTEQILSALEHAHSKKVIHRDIKPHNIMLLKNGFVKVTDFGIAKTPSGETISMEDKALGTVYYISPEQISCRETGTWSDIYSVGVMLYEMSTGKLPFDADNLVNVAMQQINDEPVPPREVCPELPKGLEQIILKAMNKKPENRFKSAHSMLRAVRILKENHNVIFDEGTPTTTTPPRRKSDNNKKSLRNGVFGGIIKFFDRFRSDEPADKSRDNGKARVTLFPIILGIATAFFLTLIVAGSIVISGFLKSQNDPANDPHFVTVPELLGRHYDEELESELEKQSFAVEVKWAEQFNDAYGYGEIYSTVPEGGQIKKIQNSLGTVDLVLYVNPEEGSEALPDYSIQNVNSVKTALRNRGYDKVEIIEEPHDTVLENYVFRTEPAAGEIVHPTDTITLYVSTGKKLKDVISMPDLVGKTKGEATVTLEKFKVEFITVPDTADVGTVIWQSVDAHTVVSPEFCDKIVLYVSDGTLAESEKPFYLVMPDLKNKTLAEAQELMREIASYGIKIDYQVMWESLPAGTVYYQSVEPDAMVLINYSKPIKVFYSDGNKPAANVEDTEEELPEAETEDEETVELSIEELDNR